MREGFLERNARTKHIMRFVIDCVDIGALRKVLSLVEVELSSGKKYFGISIKKNFSMQVALVNGCASRRIWPVDKDTSYSQIPAVIQSRQWRRQFRLQRNAWHSPKQWFAG